MMDQRQYSFDVFRAIAIIAVIFIHASDVGYIFAGQSLNFQTTVFVRSFVNFAVPLFVFISGYFLANKKVDSKFDYFSFLSKQMSRVLLPFLVWSLYYSVCKLVTGWEAKQILFNFFTFNAVAPFYFVFLILQCYILLPWLQKLGDSKKGLFISLLVSLITSIIINYLRYYKEINLPVVLQAGTVFTYCGFFISGIYFSRHTPKINLKFAIAMVLCFFSLQIMETYWYFGQFGKVASAVTVVKPSAFLYSISICLFLFAIKDKIKISAHLIKIGQFSFGIFLMHWAVLQFVRKAGLWFVPQEYWYSIFGQTVIVVLVVLICYIFGSIINRVNKKLAFKYLGF